jgi:hypothetical protein
MKTFIMAIAIVATLYGNTGKTTMISVKETVIHITTGGK